MRNMIPQRRRRQGSPMTRKSLIPPPETGKETRVATGGRATAPGPTHLPRGGAGGLCSAGEGQAPLHTARTQGVVTE